MANTILQTAAPAANEPVPFTTDSVIAEIGHKTGTLRYMLNGREHTIHGRARRANRSDSILFCSILRKYRTIKVQNITSVQVPA